MLEPIFFPSPQAFHDWLTQNASCASELLVGYHKVHTGRPSLSWSASVDEALCFGWIDGIRKRIDDDSYQIRFTPRKPNSIWSAINIAKFSALQTDGRMTAAGQAAYALRQPGKTAIYSYEQSQVAALSAQELRAFKDEALAWNYFEQCPPGYRKQILHWVTSPKRPQTRVSRFATLLQACKAGERLRD